MSKATPQGGHGGGPAGQGGQGGIPGAEDAPDVIVVPRRGPSIIWLVPILAAAIGAWLWYQAEQEKGPAITISMRSADDIERGKTQIRFKNVSLGEVEHIEIAEDLSGVVLRAQMNHLATPYLREGARFWVVRPRIGARGISGLGTLVSGAYIEMEPSASGAPRSSFVALEDPPVAPASSPGLKLQLKARDLGSLDVGSGVFFKGVQVGQVETHELAVDDHTVNVGIYIEPQFAPLVHRGTLFWNASGLQASLGADGVQVNMQSLDSLLRGGIAFETLPEAAETAHATTGDTFTLFEGRARALERKFDEFVTVTMYFTGSVRGLAIGAPVEFRGIRVGSVRDFWLQYDADTHETRIPVVCTLQRGVTRRTDTGDPEEEHDELRGLVARGLRARLVTGSLITGALFIDLDMHPDSPATLLGTPDLLEVPTIPSAAETLSHALDQLSAIATDLRDVVKHLDDGAPAVLKNVEQASQSLGDALVQATRTLQQLETLAREGSELRGPALELLDDLAGSVRSLRQFTDLLERHPEALLKGKP